MTKRGHSGARDFARTRRLDSGFAEAANPE
jgi:hypothetical protein